VAATSLITVAFTNCASRAGRQDVVQLAQAQVDDFLARTGDQIVRGANHHLQILARFLRGSRRCAAARRRSPPVSVDRVRPGQNGAIEYPLDGVVQERDERFPHYFTIEPKMNSSDRRIVKMAKCLEHRLALANRRGQHSQQRILRHSDEKGIIAPFRFVVKDYGGASLAGYLDALDHRPQPHFPAPPFDRRPAFGVQRAERHGGNPHAEALAVGQERFPENVDAVLRVRSRQLFVQRAHQHHSPKTLDGCRRLLHAMQPVQHRCPGGARRLTPGNGDLQQCAGDPVLVFPAQRSESKE
jgi:hypothetical protein